MNMPVSRDDALVRAVSALEREPVEVAVTPALDNGIAYAPLDALHTTSLEFTDMALEAGGAGIITKLVVVDKDDQGAAGVLHLFTAATTQTANAKFSPSDAQAGTYVGSISLGSWEDFDGSRVSANKSDWLYYKCAEGSTSLFGVLQTLGTPTHTPSGLVASLTGHPF